MTVEHAAWLTCAAIALIGVLTLRMTVHFLGKGADNAWDNAFAYVLGSSVVFYGAGYLAFKSAFFAAAAPLLIWIIQTVALRFIYEVRFARAWLIGTSHTLITTCTVGTLSAAAATAYAYYLYGKIVTDPQLLLKMLLQAARVILRLIGIEPIF